MLANVDEEVIESFLKGIPLANAFEYLFENASDAIYILDMHGNFVTVNRKAEELTGFKREDFIGKSFRKIIPAKSMPKAIKGFLDVIRGKQIRLELELKTAAKKTIPVEVTAAPLIINGKIVGAHGIVRDIIGRKKAEKALAKSEESFRSLMEDAPIGICNADLKGKITYVNKRFEEATGHSREEIVGKNGFKLGIMSEETLKLFKKRMKERLMGKPSRLLEGRFKRKDGEWIWAEVESRVIKKFGVPVGFQLIARDITERKRAEKERKRFEERLSALNTYSRKLNTAESMEEIYELTLDAAEKTLGFEYVDILIIEGKMLCLMTYRGRSKISSLKLPLDGDKGITVRAARTGKPVLVPDISKEKAYVEGGIETRSELAVPIKIGQRVLGVLNVESKKLDAFDEKDQELLEILASHAATAISNLEYAKNLKASAREIRESREKFERLFMDNPEVAVYLDPDFHILDVNPRFEELFGYAADEIKGKHINDVIVPKDKIEEGKMLDKKALKGYVYYDTVRKRKDGSLVPVSISAAPIIVEGKHIGAVGLYKDITERKRFEERLSALNTYSRKLNTAESMEEIYRLTLDAMEKTLGFEYASFMVADKDMLCVVDQRGFPESHASLKLPLNGTKGGVTVKAATTLRPVFVPDTRKEKVYVAGSLGMRSELAVPIKTGHRVLGVLNVESRRLDAFDEKDQELLEILASHAATAMSNLGYAQNLEKLVQERTRELKEAQEQLLRAERLAAIGEVAAMVGHDLRNPLTGIAGATYYLKMKLGSEMDDKTREMLELIENDIEHSNNIIIDLLEYSREIRLELTETNPKLIMKEALSLVKFSQNIQVLDLTQSEPKIEVDLEKMKRVFVNIVKNAIDAMPEGGVLTITSNESNGSLEIAFADTGTGMPKDVMEKLWTPFFTTKSRGMGLGLPICKRFVEAHGGSISVESTVGEGTTFTVTIPIKPKIEGGEKIWVNMPESLLSTTTKA